MKEAPRKVARSVIAFEQLTLDGYFTGSGGDVSWLRKGDDPESNAFAKSNAAGDGILVFGRVTYEMMASFWPTQQAHGTAPVVAQHMNRRQKIVFSRRLHNAAWVNSRIVREDPVEYMMRAREEDGPDFVILGSGSIVAQLAAHDLIDEYQLMLCPLAIGEGRSIFEGVPKHVNLTLTSSRIFPNGKILAIYSR